MVIDDLNLSVANFTPASKVQPSIDKQRDNMHANIANESSPGVKAMSQRMGMKDPYQAQQTPGEPVQGADQRGVRVDAMKQRLSQQVS